MLRSRSNISTRKSVSVENWFSASVLMSSTEMFVQWILTVIFLFGILCRISDGRVKCLISTFFVRLMEIFHENCRVIQRSYEKIVRLDFSCQIFHSQILLGLVWSFIAFISPGYIRSRVSESDNEMR